MIAGPAGREREVGWLDAFLTSSVEGLHVAVLVGDPGIGKSTLWRWTTDTARERSFTVLASRPAETERELTNLVLGDLFRDVDPSVIATLPPPRRRALDAALLMADDVDDGSDSGVDRRALGVAVTSVLRTLSGNGPLLIAIDDDQWMDAASADALAFAIRRSLDLPIRMLLARRRRGEPSVRLERIPPGSTVTAVDVGPLSVGAIQLLLRERLGASLSRPTLRELHRVSAGNPFHALELGRARTGDATRDLALPLPSSGVDSLILERTRTLDGSERDALLLVAANGRTTTELLERLGVSLSVIGTLVAAELLQRSGDVLGFTHPLLAAAVYEGADIAARRAAHRALAETLTDDLQRARHSALGAEGPSQVLSANLAAVARLAQDRGRSLAAADLAERALTLTPIDDTDERQLRTLAAARMRFDAGDGDRARTLLSGLLEAGLAGPRRAEALLLAAELEVPSAAVETLEEALRAASTEARLRAMIHAKLADKGRLTRGRTWAERHQLAALRLTAVIDDDVLHAGALSSAAMLAFDRADPRAEELAFEAHRLASRANDTAALRDAGTTVGHILTWSGDTARARTWLLDELATWRDRDEIAEADRLWYLALVEMRAGRWADAATRADEAMAIRAGYGVEVPQDHLPDALIALHRGDWTSAQRHSERALSLAEGMRLPAHQAILATIDLWTGDPLSAIEGFERAEAAADLRGFREPAMRFWRPDYGEALLRVGRIDDAERLIEEMAAASARIGRTHEAAGAVRVRGLIASATGDLVRAAALLAQAADAHEGAGDPFGRARATLAMGVVQRRLRQKRSARQAFEAARAMFERLGAASWADQATAESARIGGRQRFEGISPSEQRVAELVAEGRTNRDIAAALFVTERTVASHLSHLYAKLGVRSRTQLARALLEDEGNFPHS